MGGAALRRAAEQLTERLAAAEAEGMPHTQGSNPGLDRQTGRGNAQPKPRADPRQVLFCYSHGWASPWTGAAARLGHAERLGACEEHLQLALQAGQRPYPNPSPSPSSLNPNPDPDPKPDPDPDPNPNPVALQAGQRHAAGMAEARAAEQAWRTHACACCNSRPTPTPHPHLHPLPHPHLHAHMHQVWRARQ